MKNTMLTAVVPAKKRKAPPANVTPKDDAHDRNFTKAGKPRLAAMSKPSGSGEGAMGQRR